MVRTHSLLPTFGARQPDRACGAVLGVTAALTSLVERLTAIEQGRDHASQKKKHARTTLKDFLKVCAGAKIEIWKRPPTIVSLPEKLVLADADPHGLQEAAEQEEAHAAAAELLGE